MPSLVISWELKNDRFRQLTCGKAIGPAQPANEERELLARSVVLLGALPASPLGNPEAQNLLALCYLEGARAEAGRGPRVKSGAELALEILERLVQVFPGVPDYE